MKKIYLLIISLVAISANCFTQTNPTFVLTKDWVKPVVLNYDASFTANQIYTRVKDWIALTYKNPKSVIRIDNENTLVKVGSFKERCWKIKSNGIEYWNDLEYTLTIDIKDAKCRVTIETNDVRWKVWFNKDGSVIKNFKEAKSTFEASINELLSSLNNQIKGVKKKTDDW